MIRVLHPAPLFTVGLAVLVTAVLVAWLGSPSEIHQIVRPLMALLGAILLAMSIQAVRTQARERWAYVGLVGLLLMGFSGFAIFSFGILTAPIALILLTLAGWNLLRLSFSPSH